MNQYYKHIKNIDVNNISQELIHTATENKTYMTYSRGSEYYKNLQGTEKINVSDDPVMEESFYNMVHEKSIAQFDVKVIQSSHLHDKLINLVPEKILNIETPVCNVLYIHSGCDILPHIDEGRRTAINLYISGDNNSAVRFYETRATIPEFYVRSRKKLDDAKVDTKLRMFLNCNDLDTVAEFKPRVGDMYIMNVSQIHSVNNLSETNVRVVVSYNFRKKFSELCVL